MFEVDPVSQGRRPLGGAIPFPSLLTLAFPVHLSAQQQCLPRHHVVSRTFRKTLKLKYSDITVLEKVFFSSERKEELCSIEIRPRRKSQFEDKEKVGSHTQT